MEQKETNRRNGIVTVLLNLELKTA